MELRYTSAVIIFFNAYAPLSIILLVKDLNDNTFIPEHPIIISLIVIFSLSSYYFLYCAITASSNKYPPVKVTSILNRSPDLINYTIPYMISFLALDLSDLKNLISFFLFMAFLCPIYIKTGIIFMNPTLILLNYNIYDVHYEVDGHEFKGIFLVKDEKLEINRKYVINKISKQLCIVHKHL